MVHPPRRPPGRPPLRPPLPLRHFPPHLLPPLLLLLPLLAAAGARGEPWRTSKHLHAPRAYHGCAASEDAVFVLGGEGAGGEVLGSVEKFSVADRVWLRSVDPLPTPRKRLAAERVGGVVFAAGGGDGGRGGVRGARGVR